MFKNLKLYKTPEQLSINSIICLLKTTKQETVKEYLFIYKTLSR